MSLTGHRSIGTQTCDLQINQPATELLSKDQALTRSHTSNFENQLNCYRLANKKKFEIQNAWHNKKQVYTEGNPKCVHNDELANTKHKLREAKQERDPSGQLLKFSKTNLRTL